MDRKIYYFTGTGNSLKIAKDLAERLGQTELIPIAKSIKESSLYIQCDQMGIVCPVYMWGLPLIVIEFVKKIIFKNDPYIFGLATYGGFPGATLLQLDKLMEKKGKRLSAGFGIRMPGNYTPLYGAYPEKKQKKIFSKAISKINSIVKILQKATPAKPEANCRLINLIFSGIIYNLSAPKIKELDKNFWVNDHCNSCGICEKVCPVENIKIGEDHPQWLHHCQQCLACLQWCPQEAIEYGKNTPGRKRYQHPEIDIKEIFLRG